MEIGVLQITYEAGAHCLRPVAEAQERDRDTIHPTIRQCFLRSEESWTLLSASQGFTERRESACVSRRTLLAEAARASAPRLDGERADAQRARKALIAIVDDDPWALEGMSSFVGSLGYLGATFMSAEEYLDSDLKRRAGCLIVDVHLCGMSGPDLQARLLADGYYTPVIFVTAHFEEHVRNRVMQAGALGYLTKPWDERALITCLEDAVRT
jgi:CheY-like chemotaxis protein